MAALPRRGRDLGGEEEAGEDIPPHLITYGDMMSLLFSFFVALLALASWGAEQRSAATASIRSSFGVLEGTVPLQPGGGPAALRPQAPATGPGLGETRPVPAPGEPERLVDEVRRRLQASGQAGIEVLPRQEGVLIRVNSSLLFPSGSDELLPGGRQRVLDIAAAVRDLPGLIRVEGHTDDVPIHTARFPSNWELSAARAVRVVRVLTEEGGIDPRRVFFAGYGEYRPLVANVSEANRQRNRRVEVYLITASPP